MVEREGKVKRENGRKRGEGKEGECSKEWERYKGRMKQMRIEEKGRIIERCPERNRHGRGKTQSGTQRKQTDMVERWKKLRRGTRIYGFKDIRYEVQYYLKMC